MVGKWTGRTTKLHFREDLLHLFKEPVQFRDQALVLAFGRVQLALCFGYLFSPFGLESSGGDQDNGQKRVLAQFRPGGVGSHLVAEHGIVERVQQVLLRPEFAQAFLDIGDLPHEVLLFLLTAGFGLLRFRSRPPTLLQRRLQYALPVGAAREITPQTPCSAIVRPRLLNTSCDAENFAA